MTAAWLAGPPPRIDFVHVASAVISLVSQCVKDAITSPSESPTRANILDCLWKKSPLPRSRRIRSPHSACSSSPCRVVDVDIFSKRPTKSLPPTILTLTTQYELQSYEIGHQDTLALYRKQRADRQTTIREAKEKEIREEKIEKWRPISRKAVSDMFVSYQELSAYDSSRGWQVVHAKDVKDLDPKDTSLLRR